MDVVPGADAHTAAQPGPASAGPGGAGPSNPQPSSSQPPGSGPSDAQQHDAPRRRRSAASEVPLLLLLALVVTLVVRTLVVQAFYIPSGSMEQTLQVGDRVLVSRLSYEIGDIHRGDVVVFDGKGSFSEDAVTPPHSALGRVAVRVGAFLGVSPDEHDFVKRVVGLPGDRVRCCSPDGRIEVNGVPVDEPYLHPGDRPSDLTFDVVVPQGRLWVMGDHRSDSADSRAHLGDPGGGTVPVGQVVGKVVTRFWPLDRLGGPASAPALAGVPAADRSAGR